MCKISFMAKLCITFISLGKQCYKVGFSNKKPEASFKCAIKDYDLSPSNLLNQI